MSHVTDVILSVGILEEEEQTEDPFPGHQLVEQINEWLNVRSHGTLGRVDHLAGGRKAMQACVYMGAFNHLILDEFVVFVRALPWLEPSELQMWVKTEEENAFRSA